MQQLNERQLEIMRRTYPGFREKDKTIQRVKAGERLYRENPGYVPVEQEDNHANGH